MVRQIWNLRCDKKQDVDQGQGMSLTSTKATQSRLNQPYGELSTM